MTAPNAERTTPFVTRATAGTRVTDRAQEAQILSSGQALMTFDSWFGPNVPLSPNAPAEDVAGRAFDYPAGVNLTYGWPKREQSETAVDFRTLRMFAEPGDGGLDILRLVIETVKDQLCASAWKVQRVDGKDAGTAGEQATALLRSPDGARTWVQWIRSVLEDHFVLDAVAIYPRKRGDRLIFEQIDGAIIKRLIDGKGRTPLPPLPAYQQILKGVAAYNYRADELCYFSMNPRPNRLYGLGRVEQIINTAALGLRRFVHVQDYYTEGTVPDMVVGVPIDWTPDQINRMQAVFDATLAGNSGERRKVRFIPGGTTPMQLKESILKDEFDEWLARIICYAFSLSPQAFVREMNRATAETANEEAKQSGLEPMKLALKSMVDYLIQTVAGFPDLHFVWDDEEISDPKIKAEVSTILAGGKPILDQNEVRALWGYDAKTPEELESMSPLPIDPFGRGGSAAGEDDFADDEEEETDENETGTEKRGARGRALVRKALRRSLRGYGARLPHT